MDYKQLKKYLIEEFNKHDFVNAVKLKQFHSKKIPIPNKYDYDIEIFFPGYKATISPNGKIIYDYRVDLRGISISHVNIVVDIHNKALQATSLRTILYDFLIDLAKNALNVDLNKYKDLSQHEFNPPPEELLSRVKKICEKKNKNYNQLANSWSYSISELATIIPFIVLQEDINYPMPAKQGRRMSFYRYVEAIFCTLKNRYKLEDVIDRALSHRMPPFWREYKNMYMPIEEIGNFG